MEIAGLVVAVLAALAAGASSLYALGANRRADTANERANDALDLQKRIDAREREFRDVTWSGAWVSDSSGTPVFRVSNRGLTTACSVTIVYSYNALRYVESVGDLEPSAYVDLAPETAAADEIVLELMLRVNAAFRVHWSSPLGQADSYESAGLQVF